MPHNPNVLKELQKAKGCAVQLTSAKGCKLNFRKLDENKQCYEELIMLDTAVQKLLKGEELTEDELQELVFEYDIEESRGQPEHWQTPVKTIICVESKFWAIEWWQGNTEYQEHRFDNQPYRVEKVEKQVTIIEWRKVEIDS